MSAGMGFGLALFVVYAMAFTFSNAARVQIPIQLQEGKMKKYPACRALFSQNRETYAVVTEDQGGYRKVCNCSYNQGPVKGLSINCHISRETLIPFSVERVRSLGFRPEDIIYYIVKYLKRDFTNYGSSEWQEVRVEASDSPIFRIDLEVGEWDSPNTYMVEIYAVLSGGARQLIMSDEILATTGQSVKSRPLLPQPTVREGEYTQYSQSFRMNFDHITDTSMEVTFSAESPDVFKVEYEKDGMRLPLNLDINGRTTLRGLRPSTTYLFIISYYRDGTWTEMRRKQVRTMDERPSFVGTYDPSVIQPTYTGRDITLQCPYVAEENLQTVSWYKGEDRETARLLATYDAQTGVTTYPSGRDPRISVTDGKTLRIKQATPEYEGTYKCRFSVQGLGTTWGSVRQGPSKVTLYIVWTPDFSDIINTYLIQYRPYRQSVAWQNISIPNSGYSSTVVRDLEPLTQYEFEIYDYSGQTRGDLLDTLIKTTGVTDEESPSVEEEEDTEPVDLCHSMNCGRGVCRTYPNLHCLCEEGFTGQYCDVAINYCDPDPCLNGGQCSRLQTSYVCQCQDGYNGRNCEQVINYCTRSACVQGVCVSKPGSYICRCYTGYTGRRCDRLIDACESNPCINGYCVSAGATYQCQCYSNYEGVNCETAVDEDLCSISNPCVQGTCVSQRDGVSCECWRGYTGTYCDRETTEDHCNPNPCRNNGVCESNTITYTCRCRRGYKGRRCELYEPQNYCENNPCVHGSCTSMDRLRRYVCTCDRGYTGRDCNVLDNKPYIMLRCPMERDRYGRALLVRWYNIVRREPEEIYSYNITSRRGHEGTAGRYAGRLSTRSPGKLRIDDIKPSDIGIYRCRVTYDRAERTSYIMTLFEVTNEGRTITVTWRPSRLYIDHYDARYRDTSRDENFRLVELPRDAYRHTFSNLNPDGIYEIVIVPYTVSGDENEAMYIRVADDMTSPLPVSRADRRPEPTEVEPETEFAPDTSKERADGKLPVEVSAPAEPITSGDDAYLECRYPSFLGVKPSIRWKKIVGDRSIFLYNKKMPPNGESSNRIAMTDEHRLRIRNFRPSDAATYECSVTYRLDDGFRVGSGSAELRTNEVAELEAPVDFRHQVHDGRSTSLFWRQPEPERVTGFLVRYWPTTRRFGDYEQIEVANPYLRLSDLVEGNEYNVEIRATDRSGFSEPLEGSFIQTIEEVPMPTDFRVFMVSETEARITWLQPVTEGITGYKIQFWDTDRTAPNNLRELTTTVLEAILSPLVDGRVYQVWIQAKKGDRLSPQLTGQFEKTTPSTPNSPVNLGFKNVGTDAVTVHWDAPEGWKPIDKYRVKIESADRSSPLSKTFPDSAPSMLIVNNLRPGTIYRFTVYTVRNEILSEPVYKNVRTVDTIIVTAPYPETLTLVCKAPVFGQPYRVRWYKVDDSGKEKLIFTSTSTRSRKEFTPSPQAGSLRERLSTEVLDSLTISDFQSPGDLGTYKCVMKTKSGDSADIIEIIAQYHQRIEPPTHFSFEITGETTATVRWLHPYPSYVTSYYVRYWPTIRRFGNERELETEEMFAELMDLVKGTEYQVVIKSKVGDRLSDDSLIGQFINFASTVTNVTIERYNEELIISWNNPPDIDGTLFSVRSKDSARWNDQPPMAPHVTRRRVYMPLEEGDEMYFKITALKNNIPSPVVVHYTEGRYSPDVEIESEGPEPEVIKPGTVTASPGVARIPYPTPPSNLVLESTGPRSLMARWEPTPDTFFDSYRIIAKNLVTQGREVFLVPDSYHHITDLAPYGTYEVSVSTVRNGVYSFEIKKQITLSDTTSPSEDSSSTEREPPPLEPITIEVEPAPIAKPGREVSSTVPAPTNLRFSNVAPSRMTITWDSPPYEITDYGVKYRPIGSDSEWVTEDVIGGNSLTLRGLEPDTEYEIRVSSYLGSTQRSFPLIGTQRTESPTDRRVIPKQPVARVVSKTSNSFVVKWDQQPTDHVVEVSPIGGAGRRQRLTVTRGTSSVNVTGLEHTKRHLIKVTAVADGQRSRPRTLFAATNPGEPEDLRVTATDSTTISLRWTDPSTLITGYRISYFPTLTNILETLDTTENTITLTGLTPDTAYTIMVQARRGGDESPAATVTAKTKPETLDAPQRAQGQESGDDIAVTWSPVSGAEYYEIYFRPDDSPDDGSLQKFISRNPSFTIPNVVPGHYVIGVSSVKGNQPGPSRDITFLMPVKKPTDLEISDLTSNGLTARWQSPNTRLYSPGYDVIALPTSIHTPIQLPSEKRTTDTFYEFERLRPNTEYRIEVVSRYGGMKSQPLVETVTTAPLQRPEDVRTTAKGDGIRVTWAPSDDVDRYRVTYYPLGDETNPISRTVPSQRTYYDIRNVVPGVYEIIVTAIRGDHESPASEPQTEVLGVDAPRDIRFSDISDESVVVIWTPPRTRQRFEYEVRLSPADDDSTNPVMTQTTAENWLVFEDLEPETQYVADVVAVFGDQRSRPVTANVTTAGINSPRELESYVSDDVVTVSWSPVDNVDYYEVIYYPVGEKESAITQRVTSSSYDITDLEPGDYEITVTAVRSGHRSPVILIPQAIEVPKPDRVLVSFLPNQPVEIAWEEVPNADYYSIVYYSPGGSNQTLFVDGNQTNTILADLLPETEYIIEVNSIVNGMTSSPTTTRIVTPRESNPLESGPLEGGVIKLTWSDNEDVPAEYEIKYYPVIRSGDEVAYGRPSYVTTRPNERGSILSDLRPGTEYIIEIKALTEDGTEPQPVEFTVTTPLDQPENVEFEEPGTEEVTIHWNPPVGDVTQYIVEFIPIGEEERVIRIPVSPGQNSVMASGLQPDTEYEVHITAQNQDRDIESLPLVETIRTKPLVTKPRNIRLRTESDGTYYLTWDTPDYPVTYYRVIYVKNSGEEEDYPVDAEATETSLPQLVPGAEYEITLQSITEGVPIPSEFDSVTMRIRTAVPGLPDSITFPDVTDGSMIVQWEVPELERYLTGYRVQVFPEDSETPSDIRDVPRTTNTAAFTGLRPSTVYRVVVTPHIDNIPGESATSTVTTGELDVPQPDDLHISESTSEDLVVQWYPPPNHEYITEFEILVRNQNGDIIRNESVPGDTYTYTVTDLTPDSTYNVFVRSLIGERQSEPGHIVSSTLPDQPREVTAYNVLSTQFDIEWEPVEARDVSYLINVLPQNNPDAEELLFETGKTSILISDVEPETNYAVEVVAISPNGLESSPTRLYIVTGSPTDGGSTENIRPEYTFTVVPGAPDMLIRWQKATDAPVHSYQILYKPQGSNQPEIITVPAEAGEFVLSSLEPTEIYDIWVRALVDDGSIFAVPIAGKETVPTIPQENYRPLTEEPVVAPEDGKILVTWEDLGPDITQFGLTYSRGDNDDEQSQVVIPGEYSNTMLSGLTPGEEYVISVIGIRDNSQPVLVHNVNVGTPDVIPDEKAVTASSPNGQITIEWDWISDIEDSEDNRVIGYQIIFDRKCCLGEPEIAWVPGNDSNTATIGMLEPDTEYVFTVEATTSDGHNIPVSSVQILNEVETPETRLSDLLTPPIITSLEGQGYTTTVHWRPPTDSSRPITHYTITYVPVDNEYAPSLKVTVPESETSHTMTGLSPNTLYRINIQSANLISKTSSEPVTRTYLTPIDDETVPEERPEEIPEYEDEDVIPTVSVRSRSTTTPRPVPSSTPTEPLVYTHRTRPSASTPTRETPRRRTTSASTSKPMPIRNTEEPRIPDEDVLTVSSPEGQATILWEPFFDGDITGRYRVTYSNNENPDDANEVFLPAHVRQVTMTSLQPDTTYDVRVDAVTDNDEEFVIPATRYDKKLPQTLNPYQWLFNPNITDVEVLDDGTVIVHWDNPTLQPRKATYYVMHFAPMHPTDSNQDIKFVVPSDTTYYTVAGLQPGEDYEVTMEAVNRRHHSRSLKNSTYVFTNARRIVTPSITDEGSWVEYTTPASTPSTTRRTPNVLTSVTTQEPQPIEGGEKEVNPEEGSVTEVPETTRSTVTDEGKRNKSGVEVLPTFDGNVIINWTPSQEPVDSYTVRWRNTQDNSPTKTITVPGDLSWTNIPELPLGQGYTITIYADKTGEEPRLIYNIRLDRNSDGQDDGFNLRYQPVTTVVTGEGPRTRTETTREVYIPAGRPEIQLPDYSLQLPDNTETVTTTTDHEYVNWVQPIVYPNRIAGGADSITLRWNPETTETRTRNRYRVKLVPVDSSEAETIVTYVPSNGPYNIRGLQPGVSYRLFAEYIRNDGKNRAGDRLTSFVIPALSRFGRPIRQRTYGISDVWMNELLSGELVLQWEHLDGATSYTVDFQKSTDGLLHRKEVSRDSRWIVLERLAPGETYTINIYATIDGRTTQIYTVRVRRKITAPQPPIKVEWYNMYGHSVDLSWIPSGGEITGYRITYVLEPAGDSEGITVTLPANTTTYHLDNLLPGETYTISIRTLRGDEESHPLSFPLRMSVPTVRKIYFQQTLPKVVVIKWPALPDYVTGYRVRVKTLYPQGPDLVPQTDLPPDQTNFTINNVEPGNRYEFSIQTLIGDKISESVILHLWTLLAESQLSRVEQSGKWTVSWSGNPYQVDYWKLVVTPYGSQTPIFTEDRINSFTTRYPLRYLTPGIEYIVSIYGVKDNVTSSPIRIRIPANPNAIITDQGTTRPENTYATGQQLVRKFLVKRKEDEIRIELIPVTTVERYIVSYKKNTDPEYSTRDVMISYGPPATAIIRNLEPGVDYKIKVVAIKGRERSEMFINVATPQRTVLQTYLQPLTNIRRRNYSPEAEGFYIDWTPPRVPVDYYTVSYNYTQLSYPVTKTVTEPSIYVENISEGHAAKYEFSYTTPDGRTSPKSIMTMSYGRRRTSTPRNFARPFPSITEEPEELP